MTREVRLTESAARDYARILKRSKRLHGAAAANRYSLLIDKAFEQIGINPLIGKTLPNQRTAQALALHLRSVTRFLAPADRVKSPRHLVIYFVVTDEAVLISPDPPRRDGHNPASVSARMS
jgi:plasmid stabilization system protein ParE